NELHAVEHAEALERFGDPDACTARDRPQVEGPSRAERLKQRLRARAGGLILLGHLRPQLSGKPERQRARRGCLGRFGSKHAPKLRTPPRLSTGQPSVHPRAEPRGIRWKYPVLPPMAPAVRCGHTVALTSP